MSTLYKLNLTKNSESDTILYLAKKEEQIPIKEIFESAHKRALEEKQMMPWYKQNLDISIPIFFILLGLFVYIINRWIFPVSKRTINELEGQFPGRGLGYDPMFGKLIIIIGILLLILGLIF